MLNKYKFKDFLTIKEYHEDSNEPHVISADPPIKLPESLKKLAEIFKNAKDISIGTELDKEGEKHITLKSKRIYLVGGAVRDYLLNHTTKNYNLVTDASPDEIEKIIGSEKNTCKILKKDKNKGIYHIDVDGSVYNVHVMKKKTKTGEEVFTNELSDDCKHRDFTVNSLYYDISSNKIIDHLGGYRHLKDGIIKLVNSPENLKDNPIIKYKAIRLLNLIPNAKLDEKLEKYLKDNAEEDENLEYDIKDEFIKGLENANTNTKKYILSYDNLGMLKKVFPKLKVNTELPDGLSKNRAIVLASLLKSNKPNNIADQLRKLKYTDREIKDAIYLINLLWFSPDYVYDFKKELLGTGLSKRQLIDWSKLNGLDKELIEKLYDYEFRVNHDNIPQNSSLDIGKIESEQFKKLL